MMSIFNGLQGAMSNYGLQAQQQGPDPDNEIMLQLAALKGVGISISEIELEWDKCDRLKDFLLRRAASMAQPTDVDGKIEIRCGWGSVSVRRGPQVCKHCGQGVKP